ncbi:MAG: UDP-3-O-acyl-N-acetylglucosamine deacetylase [Pseudomonadota bacterium]
MAQEHTLGSTTQFSGVGVHSGEKSTITLLPASAGYGIRFQRTDVFPRPIEIKAHVNRVSGVALATKLSCPKQRSCVSTVEHLMAALFALGIDNAVIQIDGSEVPIMDGSSALFYEKIRQVGFVPQGPKRKLLRLMDTVEVRHGGRWARLSPCSGDDLELFARIEFENPFIGVQEVEFKFGRDEFEVELAPARTFGFAWEVEELRRRGLARGGSIENAVVVSDDGILNPEGLRFDDEFVRHKLLDAVGDLYLAGLRIAGRYEAHQPGHELNYKLVSALFAQPSAWCIDEAMDAEHLLQESSAGYQSHVTI